MFSLPQKKSSLTYCRHKKKIAKLSHSSVFDQKTAQSWSIFPEKKHKTVPTKDDLCGGSCCVVFVRMLLHRVASICAQLSLHPHNFLNVAFIYNKVLLLLWVHWHSATHYYRQYWSPIQSTAQLHLAASQKNAKLSHLFRFRPENLNILVHISN